MRCCVLFFFFNDTATTEIYTLSLHDALPILAWRLGRDLAVEGVHVVPMGGARSIARFLREYGPDGRNVVLAGLDRKSTRLNSSHANISYAVFCLKKKKKKSTHATTVTYICIL